MYLCYIRHFCQGLASAHPIKKKKKYIYRSESRDQYHADGYLVPSPRFGFESVFQL